MRQKELLLFNLLRAYAFSRRLIVQGISLWYMNQLFSYFHVWLGSVIRTYNDN